jgi:hypothetical protein
VDWKEVGREDVEWMSTSCSVTGFGNRGVNLRVVTSEGSLANYLGQRGPTGGPRATSGPRPFVTSPAK